MKSKRILIASSNSSIWDELNFEHFENSRQIAGNLKKRIMQHIRVREV